MHIGLDFDNTIVSYDSLVHRVAEEQGLLTGPVARNKVAVRDHLRAKGLEQTWIELQGTIYGPRMEDATAFPGFLDFVDAALAAGHVVSIVSHKTIHPFAGPPYDLHASARRWIATHIMRNGLPALPTDRIFFETTKPAKLARIDAIGCDVFVDDLPEILLDPAMPATVRKLLFDPESHYIDTYPGLTKIARWSDLLGALDA
ncbi:haloacid dehalogenase-like hydrolase (plasmid) [Azospirillum sp. 412522]|nr:hypothetical protein [Azospirillum sp. 412522]MBY6266468.1 haloacid dehalogenase-like hydrolase [Azospirillum sp. 412522]